MEVEYRLPYAIHIDTQRYDAICRKKMWQWCKITFDNDRKIWSWESDNGLLSIFYFKDESIANMFILRWA